MKENSFNKTLALSALLGVIVVCFPALAADKGQISVIVSEAGEEVPLPCRAWVTTRSKRLFQPQSDSCIPYVNDRSFSCDGRFVMQVPLGEAVIHVERGHDYWPVDKKIVIEKNRTAKVKITLKRWVHMTKEGWYSGDIHCHFGLNDFKVLRQLASAVDLTRSPIMAVSLNVA